MNGFILVDKPKGMTSFDVVFKLRKELNIKKIGHTGTLDPDTSGLLIIAVGRATKFIPILSENSKKEYVAEVKLGIKTDTGDISGKIIEQIKPRFYSDQEIECALSTFEKTYDQIPPIYSAKKVNGKRAYELARNEEFVELKASKVTIYENNLIKRSNNEEFKFSTIVSKGTYVRSLISDIAEDIGCIATMTSLVRTQTDGFYLEDAKPLSDITVKDIISLEDFVLKKYYNVEVYGNLAKMIKNGVKLRVNEEITYPCVYIDSESKQPIAIYSLNGEETKVMFMF